MTANPPTHLTRPYQVTADLERRIASLEAEISDMRSAAPKQTAEMSIVAFSADLDRLLAALTIATGAASMGCRARVFYSYWATAALRRPDSAKHEPSLLGRLFAWTLPRGAGGLRLSRMHFAGLGTAMMRHRMRSKNFADLEELIEMSAEAGVEFRVCEMSMDLLGLSQADLIDYPDLQTCGVSTFVSESFDSTTTLFI